MSSVRSPLIEKKLYYAGCLIVVFLITQEMIDLARRNAAKQNLKPPHVAFVQASLDKTLPVESGSIDCILSNCVINLLHPAGKINLLKEAYRVLKPGGRIVIDDVCRSVQSLI